MTDPHALEPVSIPMEPARSVSRIAFALVAIGGLIGATLILLIAAALSGWWRIVALALLSPMLVISVLILWRAARAVSEAGARRARTIAELRANGVVGILAVPELGTWETRIQRELLLPAGPHLWYVAPATLDSPEGQRRLHALYVILGQMRAPGARLDPPARATLALLRDGAGTIEMWDLSAFFERADGGEEAPLDALHLVEVQVVELAASAAARPRPAAGLTR